MTQLEEAKKSKMTRETKALELVTTAGSQVQAFAETIDGIDVTDKESAGAVGDILKNVKQIQRKFDDERVALVQPLNDTVKRINGHFKPIKDQCSDVIVQGKKKITVFAQEEARRAEEQRKKEIAEQKAREEAAIAAAAEAERHDNIELSSEIIDSTIKAGEKAEQRQEIKPARGETSTVSTVRRWRAEVADIKAFCKAVADGRLPADLITVDKRGLNQLAQAVEEEKTKDGIRYFVDVSTSIR